MPKLWISVTRCVLRENEALELGPGQHAIAVLRGRAAGDGMTLATGEGVPLAGGARLVATDAGAELLNFTVARAPVAGKPALEAAFDFNAPEAVLRLDQVTFPPGAIAYRHVHPGPGLRWLLKGALQIASDDHAETMAPMQPWFEDANSPVRATASNTEETAFIRAMLLPVEYFGKPTIRYLDASDAERPRLQSNLRFFDQRIDLNLL